MSEWGTWCAGLWWLCPLLFLLFVLICFFMMRGCGCMSAWRGDRRSDGSNPNESAEEILKRRYAQGEIDLARFEEMKKKISEE